MSQHYSESPADPSELELEFMLDGMFLSQPPSITLRPKSDPMIDGDLLDDDFQL